MPSESIQSTMSLRSWALLLLLSMLWGGSFFFVAIVVRAIPPVTLAATRVAVGAIILWTVIALKRAPVTTSPKIARAFLVMGIFNNALPFVLIAWGQTRIASGLASILLASTPLFTVWVAGTLLRDERFTFLKVLGTLVGFSGTALMIGVGALKGLGQDVPGQLAILGAAVSYSVAGVYGRRFRTLQVSPMLTAAGQVTASSLLLVPMALVVDRPWTLPTPGPGVWAALLALGALSTGLAYILYFRLLADAGALNVLLVTYLVPVSAIVLGSRVLGERLHALHFAGMALMALGLSAIDGRVWGAGFQFAQRWNLLGRPWGPGVRPDRFPPPASVRARPSAGPDTPPDRNHPQNWN